MALTYKDQYLTKIRQGATYTPASQTPVANTLNQTLEPYNLDIGTLYRQLDINATGPYAEKNENMMKLVDYVQGTLLQTAAEGKVLEYEDKVRDAILISSFTGRDVQTDVLPNFDQYAKQFTGIDTDKNVFQSFKDYFEANNIQKQISNLTMMLTNIPYNDVRRASYEAMLEKAKTDYATKTADVSTKSNFWRQVAASGNIVAQSVDQMTRVLSAEMIAFVLSGGLSLGSSAVSGIQNISNAARVGAAMKAAGTASAIQYTATTMMKAEAAEIADTLMNMRDENGNRIPLDIIRENAYSWGAISALVEMGDDFITPIGKFKIGNKTLEDAFKELKGLLQRNPAGFAGLFAGSTLLQTTQEGIQGAIRQRGINDAIKEANAKGFTFFREDQIQDSDSDYWSTALQEFKESLIPMAATQLLTGGLTFTTARLSQRMEVTPQMKTDASKYFTAQQGNVYDIGYIDTVGEQPVDIYAAKEGTEAQEQKKASPIMMTVNKQTGALVPVYTRDRQYVEYLRTNGVSAIQGIVISDDFVSKVGNTASANNLATILGMRIGDENPVMGYDGDTIIMDTQEGVEAAAADIENLKGELFGNPEVVSVEKKDDGNYRILWETDSGRERSVTIRAKNDTDVIRTTTGEGEAAKTIGNVNPIRRMDTTSMEGLFNSSIRKSKDQTLEDAEVEGAAQYFYSQITGMSLDEVKAAWKDDYQAIMERMPAGVDENTIEQGARFMPLLSAITGRSTEDLLNDPQNKISLVYGGKAQIARYKNGRAGYVEGSMRTNYDKDTGVTTYEIRITDIAKDSGTALVHELMHIARAMASEERLSGFVGLKGYTSKYGGMWRSDIKETEDGRYRLGARLYDTYEEAAALVEGNEERFVQDFFQYLKTGESPNAEVASFFGALKNFLQNFRSAFEKEFSEETKAAFDKLLSGEVTIEPDQTLDEAVEASDATLTDELQADVESMLEENDYTEEQMDNGLDADGNPLYSLVSPEKAKELEADNHKTAFRSMQEIDGKLYPPMATYIEGKSQPQEIGKWYQADENPGLAYPVTLKSGKTVYKFDLKNGYNTTKGVDYNPYFHATTSPFNDQFTGAYNRPNLVLVEVEMPVSDLESGYQAEKASKSVGETAWHSGTLSAQLRKAGKGERTVFLSRYNKIIRIVPEAEVASRMKDMLEGTDFKVPYRTVNEALRNELEKIGVDIDRTDMGKDANKLYSLNDKWRNLDANTQRRIDADYEYTRNKYAGTDEWMKAPNGKPTNLTARQWIMVRTPAFIEWFGDWINDPENSSKILDENGEPRVVYHWRYLIFDVFDMSRARQSMDIVGAYFSDDPIDTAEFGGWSGDPKEIPRLIREGKRVSAFLNIRNPIKNPNWDYGVTDTAGLDERNKLMAEGYDGVIRQYAEDEPAEYIAFEPNQIKSATDNAGTFSADNDSILYSIAPPVDSQEFQDWFKGSKVVDTNGDPLVVYHGSPVVGIEEFNAESRANGGEGLIYATDNYLTADNFSLEFTEGSSAFRNRLTGNKGQVYALYMSMKHPLDLTNLTEQDKAAIIEAAQKAWPGTDVEKNLEDYQKYGNDQGIKTLAWPLIQDLAAHGYDGLIARMYSTYQTQEAENRMPNAIEYGVVSPDQVKQIPSADLYSIAYHGTAADFSAFSLDKIGTGEGAQAFGWGLYVTESAGIGKSYAKADQSRKTRSTTEIRQIENDRARLGFENSMLATLMTGLKYAKTGDLSDAKVKEKIYEGAWALKQNWIDAYLKDETTVEQAIADVDARQQENEKEYMALGEKLKQLNPKRNLYKVEIPGNFEELKRLKEFQDEIAYWEAQIEDLRRLRKAFDEKTGPYNAFVEDQRAIGVPENQIGRKVAAYKNRLNNRIKWFENSIESNKTHWIPTYEQFAAEKAGTFKYLEWDEKIGVEEILRVSNAMVDELGGESAGFLHIEDAMDESDYADWKGEDLYRNLENFYESWKDIVSVDEDPRAADSTAKLASMLLHRLGYTGIRYEAERHSRGNRAARHYNYVIFDPADITILKHWTYNTDAEGAPLYSLSPARQAEVLQERKVEIENAVKAGIFVRTEFLEEFRGEEWADAELEIRDWMNANPDVVSLARSSDSLQEFKDRFFKKNRKKKEQQQELDFDDIPFDEPEGFEEETYTAEAEPEETETEDTLSDTWLEKIYDYAHAQSSQDRDRQFAAEWTSSEDKTLELAKALRGYLDAVFNPRNKSRSGGYWTTKYVYNSFKGVSNKVRMLQDGKKYNQERSSSAEIQEAQKLIRQNPRPYRNAYQLAMMGESRAAEARSGENVGMTADWMRLEAIDDDIAQEMEKLEAEEERTRRLKTDYKAKYEDIKNKLRDAEKDLAKYKESAGSKISDLTDYLTIARRKIDELNTQIKENEKDLKSAEREYSKLIEKLGGKIEDLQDQNAELRGYKQKAKQLEKQLQDRRARVEELRSQLTDAHKEEKRLNNALNALRRWKEAKEAADYRKKRIRQIQRLANFNPGSVDASFEESLMWVGNLFERDEEVMAERKSIDERIADLKAQIDTARSQGENVDQMQQQLLQLRKQKKESRRLLPPAQLSIYLPSDYLVRADNRQSAWTAEELDILLAAVKKMRADAKQMLEQKENARMSRLLGFAYGYFQQMTGRQGARNLEGEMSSFALGKDIAENLEEGKESGRFNIFRFWNAKLQRLARILDGNKEGLLYDWFVRENYRHQSEELEAIRTRLEAGEKKWKELGLKGSDLAKEGYTGTKQNGTEYSLTRGQMLGVYIYSKSELGMEKLTHYNGNNFTEADVKDIVSQLTPTEIEWADYMMADMQANYNRLAEVYYRGWNMNLGQRENYFTLVPSDAATESQLADGIDPQGDIVGKDNKAYVNKDFTKNVNPNAIYPLDLDVTRTWNWQVRKQEHFIAYGEWAKDSQYLFDHKGGQIYNVMERTVGKTQAQYFKKIVDNVIGANQTNNDFDKSYTKWLARRNSAVLIGNTGTMLKQGPSWFAAFNGDVDISEALKNAVAINATFRNFLTEHPEIANEFSDIDKAYDFIWANAPEMKDRQIDMDIMEQLSRMDGNKLSYLFNPANRAISKWTMGLVDKLVVNNLWMSRYYTVFNQQKEKGKTDLQAHEEAAFKASQFISETQPTSMRMDQSASQIDAKSSAFLRSIMVFTNQVVNTFNQLYLDVPMAFRQRNAKKAISALASSMFMIGLAAVLSGKFVRRGDEDDKEYMLRLARELIATGISASAPGFGSIVAAGLEYDSDYSTYIFGLDTVGSALKKVLTPSKKKTALDRIGSALEDLGVEAGYAIGAPVTPVKNIIKGIKNENPAYLLNGAWGQIIESYK